MWDATFLELQNHKFCIRQILEKDKRRALGNASVTRRPQDSL